MAETFEFALAKQTVHVITLVKVPVGTRVSDILSAAEVYADQDTPSSITMYYACNGDGAAYTHRTVSMDTTTGSHDVVLVISPPVPKAEILRAVEALKATPAPAAPPAS